MLSRHQITHGQRLRSTLVSCSTPAADPDGYTSKSKLPGSRRASSDDLLSLQILLQASDMRTGDILPTKPRHVRGQAPPSLVDLCVQKAIDNVEYLGNVGETDSLLLERILPHCTVEQLMHIENCTEGRDLSCVTDKLWEDFFRLKFGRESTDVVVGRMKQANASFTWRQLYQAKLKVQEEFQKKTIEHSIEKYKQAAARKQSRQTKLCTVVPQSSKSRSIGLRSGHNLTNVRSNIMKKAKVDYLNSAEVKNRAAIKKISLQRNNSSSLIARGLAKLDSGSTSKLQRKF